MTSAKHCQERRVCQVSGFRAVNKKSCQDSQMSRANRIKRKLHHQTKMSRERNVKEKGLQDVPRDGAVNGHDSQGVRRRSYKLSPFFIGFPCRNFRHPACPGSTGMDDIECIWMYSVYNYAHIYMQYIICMKSFPIQTPKVPLQEHLASMQQIFARVPLLPVWACFPMHKPVKQVIESLKALQRKYGTAQTKSTSSLCIFCVQRRLCFGPLFQVSMQRFAFLNMWTSGPNNCKFSGWNAWRFHLWRCCHFSLDQIY